MTSTPVMTLGRPNIKTLCYRYRDSHYKDKTVSWPWHSYLCNGNPNARKGRLYTEIGPLLRHAYSISYNMCGRFCFVLSCCGYIIKAYGISVMYMPTFFRVHSTALWQSYGCSNDREVSLKELDMIGQRWPPPPPHTHTKQESMNHVHNVYDISWWRHQMGTFSRYWPFVRGIHRSPVNSPHKGQWRGALIFSLICSWINGWVNNGEAGDLRRHHAHYDVIVIWGVVRQKLASMAGTSNYTPQILCNLVTCPCPLYLFLAHKLHVSYHICVLRICFVHKLIT